MEEDRTRRQLVRLKWLTAIAPAAAVFVYETVRHDLLDHWLPTGYGNVIVGLLALVLAYGFSETVFQAVGRLQDRAIARGREVAALTAMMRERERVGRELHDGLAQLVAYLAVRLDTVQELVRTGRSIEAAAELERLRALADDLSADVRESISGLRIRVAERGLVSSLQEYADEFEERYGIAVSVENDELAPEPPATVGLQLFRIVQEALTNARKHALASRVRVSVGYSAGALALVVADDGQGFDPAARAADPRRSFGLTTMRERAAELGGSLRVDRVPGAGTQVVVQVPLAEWPLGIGSARGPLATAAR